MITELTDEYDPFSAHSDSTYSVAFAQYGDKLFLAEGNYNQPNRLYEINTDYGMITELTDEYDPFSAHSDSTYSVALAQCGNKLFLAEGNKNQANRLYEINPNDGTIKELTNGYDPFSENPTSRTHSVALAQCGNKLFLAEGNYQQENRLYEINPDYSTITELTDNSDPFSANPNNALSVALAQCGDKLFLAEGNNNQPNHLYEINPYGSITEHTDDPNPFSANNNYTYSVALAQCGDKLFLAEGNYNQANRLYEINPDDGTIKELTNRYDPFSSNNNYTYSVALRAVWGQAILG